MADSKIQRQVQNILEHMPEDWSILTTHRLDIYDESQAKTQFVEKLIDLLDTDSLSEEDLAQLPTAFDNVRLGHQLSSVLEWAVAQSYGLDHKQVISFASKTMPLLAVLRSNACQNRETVIYHDCELPTQLSSPELQSIYG